MSYLSEVRISRRDAANKRLRDSYAWHQAIWEAFPGREGENRSFLFRLDVRDDSFRLYVLSAKEPCVPTWGKWESKKVVDSFLRHKRYRFCFKANPTMRRASDKRRLGIWDEKQLREWILRKAKQNGFAVDERYLAVSAAIQERFVQKTKQGKYRRGKHVAVDFQGILEVTDRTSFETAFEKGIGSAKAFGFGLLVLQPVR